MRLESARDLKLSLTSSVVKAVTSSAIRASNVMAVAAQPIDAVDTTFRTLAVGIAPHARTQYRIAVRVQRRALLEGPQVEKIRKAAKGEVDVRYVGKIVKRATAPWYQRRGRPLRIGMSVGHYNITAGTLGAFVHRRGSEAAAILSNNHVLADENRGKVGDDILQPGKYDGGRRPRDVIGSLENYVKLSARGINRVDGAIALLKQRIEHLLGIRGVGRVTGVGPVPETRDHVTKLGRTTGLTHGRVTAFELDNVVVGYDLGNLRFDGQLEIEGAGTHPFSDGGDSGSLIVDRELRGVALLFAGGDQGGTNGRGLTYANPLQEVLNRLKVDLML